MAQATSSDARAFLAHHPPFDALSPERLEEVCAGITPTSFAAGDQVIVEDGVPATHWYVIRTGTIELVHDSEVIDVLEPGEAFGHTSLLTGMAPAFTVRARDASQCFAIGPAAALVALGTPAGVRWVALTDRERLTRTGHTVHALPQLDTTRVGSLVLRPPLFGEPETTVREAAQTLTARADTAMLVQTPSGLGIVTDAEIRAKVVAGEDRADAPVASIARVPLPAVPADQLAIDATIDMLDAGVDHLVVLGENRVPLGVISASDLAGLDTHSPFAMRHAINNARDDDAVVEAALQARGVFRWLLHSGLSSTSLSRVLTLQSDAITDRLLNLSIARHGPAPAPWAWLVLGSGARREFTLGSDQDNGLAYDDSPDEIDPYFARMGAEVNEGLRRCGFHDDNNGVLAGNRQWRMSRSAWAATFEDCLTSPDNSRLIRATVAFDFRASAGGLPITPPLVQRLQRAGDHPAFVRQLGRVTAGYKPPLSFRGHITADASDRFDLKRGGIIPIVNLARFHALANRITISGTIDRLTAARQTGVLEIETADELLEGFEIISRVRFDHHDRCLQAGRPIDDLIGLDELTPIRRRELRDIFRAIAKAQKKLSIYLPPGS